MLTRDVLAMHLPADYADTLDMSEFSGLNNNDGTGVTGDIMFTRSDILPVMRTPWF